MATCPNCKAHIADSETTCPKCGRDIPASDLETIPVTTDGWQKFVIAVTIVLLIAVACTFFSAEDREDAAAQNIFAPQVGAIIQNVAMQTGLGRNFGVPAYQVSARPKSAEVSVVFPSGPLNQNQAAMFGQAVCAGLAQTYVKKGYMPRHIKVTVAGNQPGGQAVYGQAIYNGNIDALGWEAASR